MTAMDGDTDQQWGDAVTVVSERPVCIIITISRKTSSAKPNTEIVCDRVCMRISCLF